MGAGRKTQTFTMREKSPPPWTVNGSVTSRNLGKSKLAGVIFGCKHYTMQECLSKQLFGLPAPHFSYVRNINPGLPLFLFNFSDRKLHGIFEAASQGNLNIDPHAWTVDGMDRTTYAAQVKIQTRMQCHPLLEDQFRPIISNNYYEPKLFWFELDQRQTNKLIALFSSLQVSASVSSSRRLSCSSQALQPSNEGKEIINVEGKASKINVTYPDSKKKWSSLFKVSTTGAREDGVDLKKPASELNISNSNLSNYEWESCCVSHSFEEGSKSCEAPNDGCGIQNELAVFKSRNEIYSSSPARVNVKFEECKPTALKENLPSYCDGNQDSSFVAHQLNEICEVLDNVEIKDSAKNVEEAVHFKIVDKNLLEVEYGEDTQSQWVQKENYCSIGAYTDQDLKSSNCQLLTQILAKIRELKLLQEEQVQKVNLLEQELAGSKIEIQSLKSHYEMLECGRSSKNRDFEGKRLQSNQGAHANLDASVLVVGGFDGSSWLSTMNCYYPFRDSMESLPAMSSVRSNASIAKFHGEVYIFGGGHGNLWSDTVESYNLANNQWVSRPSLNRRRRSSAGVSLNCKIFAIGGGDGVQYLSEVEMFDLDTGRWIQTPSMRHERFALAAGELNGVIYAVGGFDGKSYLNSAEMFDPRENSWRGISSMSTKKAGHCLAVLNEKIYVMGGFNGEVMSPTVEVFDPRRGSWTATIPMNEARGYSAAAVLGDAIYVFSGFKNDSEISERVECYVEDRGWELTNLRTLGKRCHFSAVVL